MNFSYTSSTTVESNDGEHREAVQHGNREVEILRASQPLHVTHTPLEIQYNIILVRF